MIISKNCCHSPCGSVDWNCHFVETFSSKYCHSPCGSVDWNCQAETSIPLISVTPLAGVWIEIFKLNPTDINVGHSPCGSVDWNAKSFFWSNPDNCHSPCGSVDWNSLRPASLMSAITSLPLRECGLKSCSVSLSALTWTVTPLAGVWIEIYTVQTDV